MISPSLKSASTTLVPIKPEPPVTNSFIFYTLIR
jgi:hypothetical protein